MASANPLAGRSILIVEDELLIAWHLAQLIADGGANPLSAGTCNQALQLTETEHPAAAILDYAWGDGAQTKALCGAEGS